MSISPSRPLRVFLCHSSGDKPLVRELYQKLNAEGWIDVWLDEEKLLPGQDWEYEIEKALDNSDAVFVTLSTGSVSKEGYVQRELRFVLDIALEKPEGTIFVLPLRLDDCERPRKLRNIHGVDYFPPERREWAYAQMRRSLELRANALGIITDEVKAELKPAEPAPKKEEPKLKPTPETQKAESNHKTPAKVTERPVSPPNVDSPDFEIHRFGNINFREVPEGKFFTDNKEIDIPYRYFISLGAIGGDQYAEYVKANGIGKPFFANGRDRTVLGQVTLEEAQKFCQWLDQSSKIKNELPPGMVIRLPTVAEYKKAGSIVPYYLSSYFPFVQINLLGSLAEKYFDLDISSLRPETPEIPHWSMLAPGPFPRSIIPVAAPK